MRRNQAADELQNARLTPAGWTTSGRVSSAPFSSPVSICKSLTQEAKCADSQGNPCDRQTVGLLQRRHIKVDQIRSIGKESNSLESVEEGTAHPEVTVYTEYTDPKKTEWITKIQPALKKPKLEVLVEACGKRLSRREIIELRAGGKKPHRRTQQLLESILKRLGFL